MSKATKKKESQKKRWCTLPEFAKFLEVSTAAVRLAKGKRRIVGTVRRVMGKDCFYLDLTTQGEIFAATSTKPIDVERAYREYDDFAARRNGKNDGGRREQEEEITSEDDLPSVGFPDESRGSFSSVPAGEPRTLGEANLQRAKYQAMQAKVVYEREAGLLIDVQSVKNELESIAVKVQKGILSIPDRVAAIIAGESDTHRVRTILTGELKSILVNIADDIKRISP